MTAALGETKVIERMHRRRRHERREAKAEAQPAGHHRERDEQVHALSALNE